MEKVAKQLDREIAESYLGMQVTAKSSSIPRRSVTGVATKVDTSAAGRLMLWLDQTSDGMMHHVFFEDVVPVVPQAVARRKRER